ncbi:hypothetical protein LTR56_015402 [Elasticomyces elasticus]|nr:hypothetical protein LTR22_023480 [Elasticomyces elasticus]KAK3634195.1 hypothetical protein LTR56_015402 [Elasticomyces elasticus]KAK4912716.1 hypothetical protein LTR49_018889 [Elasticomyces elasticus]KAK5761832.1 hypothetical protein LTS12_008087 [Elasticomyces elasticus]
MAFGLTMLAIVGCLISTISAAPQPGTPTLVRRSCNSVGQQIANFEDIPQSSIPEIAGNPFETIPTPYKYLSWKGFTYGKDLKVSIIGQKLLPGINLDTPTHFAATGIIGQTAGGKPRLTAVYENSEVLDWSLESLAYACVVNLENGVTDVATACTITLTATTALQQGPAALPCTAELEYNPPAGLGRKNMAKTALTDLPSCFQSIIALDFEYTAKITGKSTDPASIAMVLDTVVLTPYICGPNIIVRR